MQPQANMKEQSSFGITTSTLALKQLMARYITHFHNVQFKTLLQVANLSEKKSTGDP
jgi:hypothetical protein